MNKIKDLALLLDKYNSIGNKISSITNRPATIGHTGEFLASIIFCIELEESASKKAIDGHFSSGPLKGKSVNIKWYGIQESLLDISPTEKPDYYLVMTGQKSNQGISKGGIRPWIIDHVYLFDSHKIIEELKSRNVKIGIASSVRKNQWEEAQIYPTQNNKEYLLTSKQVELLRYFKS